MSARDILSAWYWKDTPTIRQQCNGQKMEARDRRDDVASFDRLQLLAQVASSINVSTEFTVTDKRDRIFPICSNNWLVALIIFREFVSVSAIEHCPGSNCNCISIVSKVTPKTPFADSRCFFRLLESFALSVYVFQNSFLHCIFRVVFHHITTISLAHKWLIV